ncbi:MAG: ABC transporter substrate-binding protein, partial [Candidatus Binataceae bacterium]
MKITLGLSLALSGKYAPMGRQADAALRLFVADTNAGGGVRLGDEHAEVALDCIDDQSDPARCAEIYRALIAENRADLLLGPYSSDLAAAAAPIAEAAG